MNGSQNNIGSPQGISDVRNYPIHQSCSPNTMVYYSDSQSPTMGDQAVRAMMSTPVSSPEAMGSPMMAMSIKKRKGNGVAGKSIEEELCTICGDRASGYHYNALSCEGCKGFFRRSITRGATYDCKFGGNCEMDMWMRRKCQSCRLRRCREVGMKEECLLSDEQCKARDARRKSNPAVRRQSHNSPDSMHTQMLSPKQEQALTPQPCASNIKPATNETLANPLERVKLDTKQLIEKVVISQDRYELPDPTQVKKINLPDGTFSPKDMIEVIFTQMAEQTILVTQLIVEFAKHLPGFLSIPKEDQIVLLKGSACEVMILRTARRYDLSTDTVIFADGQSYTRNSLRFGGLQHFADSMYDFCRSMGLLQVDNAEYGLITSICIFSERPGLLEPKKIERIQEIYLHALEEYIRARRPQGSNFLAKLLMKLTELRTLSAEHSEVLLALKVNRGFLPPLLMEYFDVEGDSY